MCSIFTTGTLPWKTSNSWFWSFRSNLPQLPEAAGQSILWGWLKKLTGLQVPYWYWIFSWLGEQIRSKQKFGSEIPYKLLTLARWIISSWPTVRLQKDYLNIRIFLLNNVLELPQYPCKQGGGKKHDSLRGDFPRKNCCSFEFWGIRS